MADEAGGLPRVREGQTDAALTRAAFGERFRARFYDPVFEPLGAEIARLEEAAWRSYDDYHKSPRTRRAGAGFADPDYELPVEWLEARAAIQAAQQRHEQAGTPHRVLVVCASPRTDQTCPGEMSKTFRLAEIVRAELERGAADVDFLDLSMLTAQYQRVIYPCKACVSTAMPLCHWPCSCYPNHAIGQVNDWMNELYPRWVEAHGVIIVTPVHWYQAPSVLKLMIDRLVCADGGNPDPTLTQGKNAALAKQVELDGWSYPRHLAGRVFGLVVHGDVEGVDAVRRSLHDWMAWMHMIPAQVDGQLGRYIGYYEPYATSHDALDADDAVQQEARLAARAVLATIEPVRAGTHPDLQTRPGPRQK